MALLFDHLVGAVEQCLAARRARKQRLFAGFWFEHDLCSNGHLSSDLDDPIGRNLEIIRRIIG